MKKTPIFMSAAVCPGIGQFMQGRKLTGTVFLVLILASSFAMLGFFFCIIAAFCKCGFIIEDLGDMKRNYIGLAVSLLCVILVYILGVIDTIRAARTPPPIPSKPPTS